MNIDIIVVGSIKESFYRDAVAEYTKRLSRYAKVNILEVKDEKTPDHASDNMVNQIKDTEGKRILDKCRDGGYIVALAIQGHKLTSEKLADMMASWETEGRGHISFIIGGSLGLSDEVLKKADYQLSFSDMTYPHQLMRVILCEQIYRSYRIRNNEPYHK